MKRMLLVLFIFVTVSIFATNVMAVEFSTIRDNMNDMTKVQWKLYSKHLVGEQVCWTGWISDVEQEAVMIMKGPIILESPQTVTVVPGKFKILIDMDPPGSLSVQDVYIDEVSASTAMQFSKNQKVTFTGHIEYIMNVLGSCAIHLKNVTIN